MRRTCFRSLGSAALLALLAAVGCDDAATEPSALLLAGEAEAALQVALDLPTLPTLVERALPGAGDDEAARRVLEQARALWLEAEAAGDAGEASALRERAYALATPHLAQAIDTERLLQVQDSLRRWIHLATAVAGIESGMGIGRSLDEARAVLDAAGRAEPTDHPGAVEATLRAADLLLETTPRAVALRLAAEAEARLAAARAEGGRGGDGDGTRLERAERMVRGAREAVGEREYLLAIRRAYYARQLLDGR